MQQQEAPCRLDGRVARQQVIRRGPPGNGPEQLQRLTVLDGPEMAALRHGSPDPGHQLIARTRSNQGDGLDVQSAPLTHMRRDVIWVHALLARALVDDALPLFCARVAEDKGATCVPGERRGPVGRAGETLRNRIGEPSLLKARPSL